MLDKAIEKIKSEMGQNKSNQYIQVVGEFLLQHLKQDNPGASEKIMADGKTIGKSLDAMRKEARKKASGGVAMLTDAEGFAVVLKYFGVNGDSVKVENPKAVINGEGAKPTAKSAEFIINLDDLL